MPDQPTAKESDRQRKRKKRNVLHYTTVKQEIVNAIPGFKLPADDAIQQNDHACCNSNCEQRFYKTHLNSPFRFLVTR
jgi:hypothetical protein